MKRSACWAKRGRTAPWPENGISGIPLVNPSNDAHGLDGYNYVDDRFGGEGC